jgi:hypothetical protein
MPIQNSNLFPHASTFISNRFREPNPFPSITLSLPSLTRVIVPMSDPVVVYFTETALIKE